MTAGELRNLVFMTIGDPYEKQVTQGVVDLQLDEAFKAFTRLAVQNNAEAFRGFEFVEVRADRDVYDIPREIYKIGQVITLLSKGEDEIFIHKIASSDYVQQDIVQNPLWAWHYVGDRRIRLIRPDSERGRVFRPGMRIQGYRSFLMPKSMRDDVDIPDGGLDWIRYRAALRLVDAPGTNFDPAIVQQQFHEANEEAIRAMMFLDAAAPPPQTEVDELWR